MTSALHDFCETSNGEVLMAQCSANWPSFSYGCLWNIDACNKYKLFGQIDRCIYNYICTRINLEFASLASAHFILLYSCSFITRLGSFFPPIYFSQILLCLFSPFWLFFLENQKHSKFTSKLVKPRPLVFTHSSPVFEKKNENSQ